MEFHARLVRFLCRKVSLAGHAPIASHLIGPQFLDEHDAAERALGIKIAKAWGVVADELWLFDRWGVTTGMKEALDAAADCAIPVVVRYYSKSEIEPWIDINEATLDDLRALAREDERKHRK